MTCVAVVLVTHDSAAVIDSTLDSIAEQTQKPELLIAVDDNSRDASVGVLERGGFVTVRATSTNVNVVSRIAQNFVQGVRAAAAAGAEIVVLGDHDDIWHANRIEHQVDVLNRSGTAATVASDGLLIDEFGAAVPGTLRQTFPVPVDLMEWPRRKQWSFALRHSLATGGASAIRLSALDDWSVPEGWLHDRWWSLEALRNQALLIDPTPVIDYRVLADQQVGLDTAGQESPIRWSRNKLRTLGRTGRRAADLTRLMRK